MDNVATETVLAFLMETRDFTIARLSEENLTTPVADPTDDVLNAYYTDNIANYTQPESKDITYAVLSPDMLIDQIQVDQAALQAEYDNRIDQYQQPERAWWNVWCLLIRRARQMHCHKSPQAHKRLRIWFRHVV